MPYQVSDSPAIGVRVLRFHSSFGCPQSFARTVVVGLTHITQPAPLNLLLGQPTKPPP
jgi:hypothetical protein